VLDEGGELNYIRARYYDAGQARFVSKDSKYGTDLRSQTLNRYIWALNRPVRFVDVSGFTAKDLATLPPTNDGPSNAPDFIRELIMDLAPIHVIIHHSTEVAEEAEERQEQKTGRLTEADKARLRAEQQRHLAEAEKANKKVKLFDRLIFGATVVKAGADLTMSVASCVPAAKGVTTGYKGAKLGLDVYQAEKAVLEGDVGSGLEFATRRTAEDVVLKGGAQVVAGEFAGCGVGIGLQIGHSVNDIGEAWEDL
jgi:RHS repeat-associated protein